MAKYVWRIDHNDFDRFMYLMHRATQAEARMDLDAYHEALDDIRHLPGFPAEMSSLDECSVVVEQPLVVYNRGKRILAPKEGLTKPS